MTMWDFNQVALAVVILLFASVWMEGGTFGQRCTAAGYVGSDWDDCVYRLARGESE